MGRRGIDLTWPNPATAMAMTVIDELVRNGVTRVVLSPGSRSAALAMAAVADDRVEVSVSIDERSAGFFALGAARASGRPVVIVTTSGTAAANLLPALVEADQSAVPLVAMTADRPHELRRTGSNQTIDQVKLYGEVVRLFAELPAGADFPGEPGFWRSTICQVLAAAGGWKGRPGPVHLNLCFREPVVPASDDGRVVVAPYLTDTGGRPAGGPWTAVGGSGSSKSMATGEDWPVRGRVVVVAGSAASTHLVESALAAGCVVLAECHGGGRIAGTISTAHHLLASPAVLSALAPDQIVLLGRAGLSRNLAAFIKAVGDVVVSGDEWADPERNASQMTAIARFVAVDPDPEYATRWRTLERVARQTLDDEMNSSDLPSEPRTARDVFAAAPEGGVLVVGSSMPVRDLDWFAAPRSPIQVISNRGASGIDGIVSLAIGAASETGSVLALAGDLSLLYDQNGLLIEPRPDLVLVIVNNRGGGIFSFLPQVNFPDHFERVFATPTRIDISDLARMYGLSHRLIGSASTLTAILSEAMTVGGMHLIEIRSDRLANVDLHRALTAAVVAAVASSLE